jgi:mannose-6-phosphate isomerase-like protein (cupin superfamily)
MGLKANLAQEFERARGTKNGYLEFLRARSMSLGVYVLGAGATDRQSPHGEDEVYHVIKGRANFELGAVETPVSSGDVLFVGAGQPHRFKDITEELVLLVIFSPPEGTAEPAST